MPQARKKASTKRASQSQRSRSKTQPDEQPEANEQQSSDEQEQAQSQTQSQDQSNDQDSAQDESEARPSVPDYEPRRLELENAGLDQHAAEEQRQTELQAQRDEHNERVGDASR